ncbi:MAG: 3-phosphoshikimate 1-carboxyvinyltransferase [Prevotellaceae bacterium]|jgi:3-phosphoshikimate 1-carboxyvinyltransferase|nr:3-phosphoshikimate 1-carboxyvinyltransferase [Prevotellaceae bacterium]
MIQIINPSTINGTIQAPASKSIVQRVLAAALLSNGSSTLTGFTTCDDAEAAIGIVKSLGAIVTQNNRIVNVSGNAPRIQESLTKVLYCGESGLSARLFAPVSLLFSNNVLLEGEDSLLKRPFTMMETPFRQLGVECKLNNAFLPLRLLGSLKPGKLELDGSGGSQFLSGLLMALPLLNTDSTIQVVNLQSKPYIDLTIEVLQLFGISISHSNYEVFYIEGNQQYIACEYAIEGDWSAASCLLVAGAIAGSVGITGLKRESQQADKAIVDVLKSVGAKLIVSADTVQVTKNELYAFEFDASHCPDLFPALAILAANCSGISCIAGINRLVNKESNRALTLQTELAKTGIKLEFEGNSMLVYGGQIAGGEISAHDDHRIAMAMAVAALAAQTPVSICGAKCVDKSYPAFFEDLKLLKNSL